MAASLVHYLPIVTTVVSAFFATIVLRRYVERGGAHLAWWGMGLVLYGVGTATESAVTLFGWSDPVFRLWYIAGALLGGAPLAQGTVHLLMRPRAAWVLSGLLVTYVLVASVFVLLTPIDHALVEEHRLTGRVMEWSWVRLFSPFVNTYALLFLVGGAVVSAVRYKRGGQKARFQGNVLIAVGALLPGIGGSFTRFGYTEVLYVTELVGLLIIFAGYRIMTAAPTPALVEPAAAPRPHSE